MEIKTKYEVDEKYFSDLTLAKDYVKTVEEEKAKRERLVKEKEDRKNEVNEAYDTYLKLRDKYLEDYNISSFPSFMRFF
jgi:hypothetical protein